MVVYCHFKIEIAICVPQRAVAPSSMLVVWDEPDKCACDVIFCASEMPNIPVDTWFNGRIRSNIRVLQVIEARQMSWVQPSREY